MATSRDSCDEKVPLQLGQHSTGPTSPAAARALGHVHFEEVQLQSGSSNRMEEGRHGSGVDVADLQKLRRLSCEHTLHQYSKHGRRNPGPKRSWLLSWFYWYTSWAIPGLGMFSEAYIIFSIGLIKPLQKALFPTCFSTHTECNENLTHVQNYVQICGIIAGMLFFGALGDVIGRRMGSRLVATIMLSGSVLLVFTPLISVPATYLSVYIFAATWYGFGVGGEYPMASASAAERSQADPALRKKRGQQVVLTFSGQGMGNLVNGCVILIFMAMFGLTGSKLTAYGSRAVIMLQFAVAAAVSLFMAVWRWTKLKESKVWEVERHDATDLTVNVDHDPKSKLYTSSLRLFWPRLVATCMGWVANDFAFYGNKLFQSTFIALLYPTATEFERMQWTVLNSAISLMGYWTAAAVVDKPWYGRVRMQNIGFIMMFVLFLTCGVAFPQLVGSPTGLKAFQALYFLSSYFNQFGPNCTTWLVAAEVFPTDVRATFQGGSAAAGKVGAIIADVVFGYVAQRTTFYLSSAFGLIGFLVTWVFLPDTTELSLDELDRLSKYALADEFHHYHGEAINPKYLSWWERTVCRWHTHYDPAQDQAHREVQEEEEEVAALKVDSMAPEVRAVELQPATRYSAA